VGIGVLACAACHTAESPFAADFARPGAALEPHTVVQRSYFDTPLDETVGYRELMRHLASTRAPRKLVEAMRVALVARHAKALALPGIVPALQALRSGTGPRWLEAPDHEIGPVSSRARDWLSFPGNYVAEGKVWHEAFYYALSDEHGRFRWWHENQHSIPFRIDGQPIYDASGTEGAEDPLEDL
jgi:hypothetical protein